MKESLNAVRVPIAASVVLGTAGVARAREVVTPAARVLAAPDSAQEVRGSALVVHAQVAVARAVIVRAVRAREAIVARVQADPADPAAVRGVRMTVARVAMIADSAAAMIGAMIFRRSSPRLCVSIFSPSLRP